MTGRDRPEREGERPRAPGAQRAQVPAAGREPPRRWTAGDADPATVIALQRTAGNAAVSRALAQPSDAGGDGEAGPEALGGARAGRLLTDDERGAATGAMPVPEFLARLRQALAGVPALTAQAAATGPVAAWLEHAEVLGAARLEAELRRLTPRAATAESAEELVAVVSEQLRTMAAESEPAGETPVLAKRADGAAAPADTPEALLDRLGPGEPLAADVRDPMGSAFGDDFADVRLHRDAGAAALSRELSARAFAVGPHVAFGAGEYAPGTPVGDALIAHELAHVQQQRGADSSVERKDAGAAPAPALEEDADRSAIHAVASLWGLARDRSRGVIESAMPRLKSGLRLNRCAGARATVPGTRIPAGPVAVGEYGGTASGAPANWSQDVATARAGSAADRFALVRTALPGVTIVDKTADCSSDAAVNPAHLVAYDGSSRTVNYDDNLHGKQGRGDSGGFTKTHNGRSYVVLGSKALTKDFYETRLILNHEFDHVRQNEAGSKLRGDEAEVDAWTSSFCREFHRNYVVRVTSGGAHIQDYQTFSSLLGYYERTRVDSARDEARKRIKDYYAATIAPHRIHARVFRFWLHRTLKSGAHPLLAQQLNTELQLGVDPSAELSTTRQFPAAELAGTGVPAAPSVDAP
jgi:hypothetical protein